MSSSVVRRTGALALVAVLGASGLSLAGPVLAADPAPAASDPSGPPGAGARWLTTQLDGGLVHGEWGPDHGLSIDVALALDAVSGSDAAVQDVADALAASIGAYVSGAGFGDPGSIYAGATAKAAVLAATAGRDPRAFGGSDLVADLEQVTTDAGPAAGRIVDRSTFGDYANALGQSYAARALHAAGSDEAAAATGYLLDQQCAAGFFRLELGAVGAAETCDGDRDAAPDTDVTALAVLSLLPQADDAAVRPHLAAALGWLQRSQRANGSFGGGVDTEAPNANSTGLAGWALGAAGRPARAARAAGWVRGLQLAHAGACTPYRSGDLGAIAYDAAGLATVAISGVAELRDQVRRASAQALPVLTWAPGRPDTTLADAVAPPRFHRAGARVSVRLAPLAPGEPVCVTVAGSRRQVRADHAGTARARMKLPARTATHAVRAVALSGPVDAFPSRLRALAATTPTVKVGTRLTRGRRTQVGVRGLAALEPVTLRLRGRVVARGTSNARGRWSQSFRVAGKTGPASLVLTGAFGERRRAVTVTVVPR